MTPPEAVGEALAQLSALAAERERADLSAEADVVRRDSPSSLSLVSDDGADATRFAGWIARTVPDLAVRIVDRPLTADGLGKIAFVLRADRLVDSSAQDRVAVLSALAAPRAFAVVAVGAGALGEGGLERVGRGLGRVLRPHVNLVVADLPAQRIFLFEDGAVPLESDREPLQASLLELVEWLRAPRVPDASHRAALGLRILSELDAEAPDDSISRKPGGSYAERLRALSDRVIRQFESEFETASASVEASLAGLERDVDAVLREGTRSADPETPVEARVAAWEARAHAALDAMLDRTRSYAESLLRDAPWEELEERARAATMPGGFRSRLLEAWREADEVPLPHIGESVRETIGDVPTTPQSPPLVQTGLGVFGGAVAYFLLGPVVGIGIVLASIVGPAVGSGRSKQAASDLGPVFAEARAKFAENMAAYLDGIRVRTRAILDEAASIAEHPAPASSTASRDAILDLRERLSSAAALP